MQCKGQEGHIGQRADNFQKGLTRDIPGWLVIIFFDQNHVRNSCSQTFNNDLSGARRCQEPTKPGQVLKFTSVGGGTIWQQVTGNVKYLQTDGLV